MRPSMGLKSSSTRWFAAKAPRLSLAGSSNSPNAYSSPISENRARPSSNVIQARSPGRSSSIDTASAASLPALSLHAEGGSTGPLANRDFSRAKISMVIPRAVCAIPSPPAAARATQRSWASAREHLSPSTRLPTDASEWRAMVLISSARKQRPAKRHDVRASSIHHRESVQNCTVGSAVRW
jgi:hypothetical protein